jgi:hypothetical protein
MHSLEVIHRNGFFYRKENNKRLAFKNNVEYTIVSMHKDSVSDVSAESNLAARCSGDLINEIQSKKDVSWFHNVLSKGSILNFNIKVEGHLVIFKVLLEEDQYIIKKRSHQRADPILYPCKATLQKIEPESLLALEPIIGSSLNELYKKVYVHYLGNNGNPSCNAFTKFYSVGENGNKTLDQY